APKKPEGFDGYGAEPILIGRRIPLLSGPPRRALTRSRPRAELPRRPSTARRGRMRRSIGPVLTALLCLTVSGCKVTSEDIDYWTGTVKGPGKIVAVLLADKYESELRVHAGLALVRMEPREDLDGITELQAAVRGLPEDTRREIVDQMT